MSIPLISDPESLLNEKEDIAIRLWKDIETANLQADPLCFAYGTLLATIGTLLDMAIPIEEEDFQLMEPLTGTEQDQIERLFNRLSKERDRMVPLVRKRLNHRHQR